MRDNRLSPSYGDPKLRLERSWLLSRGLRQRGIRELHGDLVLDHGYFAVEDRFPVSFDGAPFRLYNTIPTALLSHARYVYGVFRQGHRSRRHRAVIVHRRRHPK